MILKASAPEQSLIKHVRHTVNVSLLPLSVNGGNIVPNSFSRQFPLKWWVTQQ